MDILAGLLSALAFGVTERITVVGRARPGLRSAQHLIQQRLEEKPGNA